jgi:hypothetical protein
VNADDRTHWLKPSPPLAVDGEDAGSASDAREGERDPEREGEGGADADG